ncbi:MAG: cytochrome c biogenesis CcdA family protein [Candidatus Thorarchaeota archaeon]
MQGAFELGLLLVKLSGVFGAGFFIAISPCLFPLLPLFLINSLQSADSRGRSVLVTGVLVLGILTSVAFFIAIAGFIGSFLIQNYIEFQAVLGLIIIFLGIVMISSTLQRQLRLGSLSLKSQPSAPTNLFNVFAVGLGYSLLAAPCSGPAILGTFVLFGAESNVLMIVLLFTVLSIAIALPYFLIAIVTGEARTRMTRTISSQARKIEVFVGAVLVIIGFLLFIQLFGFRFYLL